VLAIRRRVATGSPSLNFQRFLECSSVDEGRSIVPNRSELEATAASKANSRRAVRRLRLRVGMVDRLSPIDRSLKPPQPVRQNSRRAVRRLRLRVGMVDRLSPIDRSLKAPQPVRQNSRRAVRRLRLRVGTVDRLSPIDRSLKPPQPVRQNSRRAVRRLRLRVVGEPLGTMALHWKTPPMVLWDTESRQEPECP
jgi:ribosomal protein S11